MWNFKKRQKQIIAFEYKSLINDQFIANQKKNTTFLCNQIRFSFLFFWFLYFRSRTTLHFILIMLFSLHFDYNLVTVIDWFIWFFHTALCTARNQLCCSGFSSIFFCDYYIIVMSISIHKILHIPYYFESCYFKNI